MAAPGSLTNAVKRRAYRLLPLATLERLVPRALIGFHYHVVSHQALPHVRHLYGFKTPEQFEGDLRYLQRHYELLSYPDLLSSNGRPHAGRQRAILTFDDGYRECFSVVRPILLRFGIPCTFFVTTGFLDNQRAFHRNLVSLCIDATERVTDREAESVSRDVWPDTDVAVGGRRGLVRRLRGLTRANVEIDRACERLGVDVAHFLREERPYLTREQVRTLASDGFTIGAHTRTHPVFDKTDPPALLESEIAGSCREVCAITGASQVPFAFPVHGGGVDRDFLAALRAREPSIGLIFDTGRLRRDRDFIVHRIPVERPQPAAASGMSNIPDHLRRAYVNEGIRSVRQAMGRVVAGRIPRSE